MLSISFFITNVVFSLRTWARKMFEDYTWDTGDFARKEIVRYMSDPGQATAYMLGRLELIKMRRKAEKELGKSFNLKQFHYQVFHLKMVFNIGGILNWIKWPQK